MRYLIIGLGVIARRHVENIRAIDPDAHIIAWRRAQASPTAENIDGVVTTLASAVATNPEMALITNPAPFHIEAGFSLAQHGVHLFIEKPISDRLEGIDKLISLCQEKRLTLMVGYNFRFYQPFRVIRQALQDGMIGKPYSIRAQVGQYLPEWRPDVDYREGVSAQRSLGGGVVLELSHELDYVRWFMGEVDMVSAHLSKISDLEIDVEDIAEITLGFHSGAVGNIHMNMVQTPVSRSCRIIGSEGTISWDQSSHQVLAFLAGDEAWRDISPAQPIHRNDSYMAEIQHFIECVKNGHPPDIGGESGRNVMELALAAKRSAQDQRVVRVGLQT